MIHIIKSFSQVIQSRVPWLAVVAVFAMLLWFTARWLSKNKRLGKSKGQFSRHLIMLGELHFNSIEIASPSVMFQRLMGNGEKLIPLRVDDQAGKLDQTAYDNYI